MPLAGSPAVASRPAEAALCLEVTCEHPDARLPSEYAGFGENFLRTQQAHTNTRPTPALSWMGATCSRHEPRSHHIAGLTRSNARGRSDLHSPSDACTFQACAAAGMPQIRAGRRQRRRTSVITANIHVEQAGGSGLHSDIGILGCLPAGYGLSTRYPPPKRRASPGPSRASGSGR